MSEVRMIDTIYITNFYDAHRIEEEMHTEVSAEIGFHQDMPRFVLIGADDIDITVDYYFHTYPNIPNEFYEKIVKLANQLICTQIYTNSVLFSSESIISISSAHLIERNETKYISVVFTVHTRKITPDEVKDALTDDILMIGEFLGFLFDHRNENLNNIRYLWPEDVNER